MLRRASVDHQWPYSLAKGQACQVRTNHVHGSRGTLQGDAQNSQGSSPPIDRVVEEILHARILLELCLAIKRLLDIAQFLLGTALAIGSMPKQRFESLVAMTVLKQPARGFRDEEETNRHEQGNNEDEAQRDQVGLARQDLGGEVIDNSTDKGADRRPDLE